MQIKNILLIAILSSGLYACEETGTNNQKPEYYLVSDAENINVSGDRIVRITNMGSQPMSISTISLATDHTQDTLIDETCNNTTLESDQWCTVKLTVYAGEAGISDIKVHNNMGIAHLKSHIDTTGEGILDTDEHELKTTKDRILNLTNKGSMALTVGSLNLEGGNNTLQYKDINCINKTLQPMQNCQIKFIAKNKILKQHSLLVTTNNKYLRTQNIPIYEKTDTQTGIILMDGISKALDSYDIKQLGLTTFQIVNSGTSDENIKRLHINDNIGTVLTDECTNQSLQAQDSCKIVIDIKANAYGNSDILADTDEITNFKLANLNIDSAYLTVNNSHDIVTHTLAKRTVTLTNNSQFMINLDKIINIDDITTITANTCGKSIAPQGNCSLSFTVNTDKEITGALEVHYFNDQIIQKLQIHVLKEGLALIYQPQPSTYYDKIPKDSKHLYQVFTVTNNSLIEDKVYLTANISDNNKTLYNIYRGGSDIFIGDACDIEIVENIPHINIKQQSTCEFIIYENNNYETYNKINRLGSVNKINFTATRDNSTEQLHLNQETFHLHLVTHKQMIAPNYSEGNLIAPEDSLWVKYADKSIEKATTVKQNIFRMMSTIALNFNINQGLLKQTWFLVVSGRNFVKEILPPTANEHNLNHILYDVYNFGLYNNTVNKVSRDNVSIKTTLNCDINTCNLSTNFDRLMYEVPSQILNKSFSLPMAQPSVEITTAGYFN